MQRAAAPGTSTRRGRTACSPRAGRSRSPRPPSNRAAPSDTPLPILFPQQKGYNHSGRDLNRMLIRTLRFAPVVLVLALAISAGCTGTQTSAANATSGHTDLSVEEFKQMVDQFQGRPGEATILDVRTDPEFQREHLLDAVNLD